MIKKLRERLSVARARRPSLVILGAIIVFNIFLGLFSAILISSFSLPGTEGMSFGKAAYYTITMILDAGCIDNVIRQIGRGNVVLAIICLAVIIVGMISFTGAVIGYITNTISNFIDNSQAGAHRLRVSGHVVILNWNSRASEIVNDLLYCDTKQTVVVLVSAGREEILKEIHERLVATVMQENQELRKKYETKPFFERLFLSRLHRFKMTVTAVVREGDVFSSKQLHDICLEHAKTVIILGDDINNTVCRYGQRELQSERSKGNPQTIKSLMQVADITAADYSDDEQKIVVEITDDWTEEIVDKIIAYKRRGSETKCNIVPVRVNRILGQLLSQFSIMPELNHAYTDLFSNKGATFYYQQSDRQDENEFIRTYLAEHRHAIPLTVMKNGDRFNAYYSADSARSIQRAASIPASDFKADVNLRYTMERKNVVILGHNSKCDYIMRGFQSFVNEWSDILHILVIDDEKHLEKVNYYRAYPFVERCVVADIYDAATITGAIDAFASANDEDTSVLILSDDEALNENLDENALANLICIQEIITAKKDADPNFDEESIDVIVELIDPKHHDIVKHYSNNNVIISNRYISKMITQIGEKDALFDFYCDILSYDDAEAGSFESKEVYAKKVSRFFNTVPPKCTAAELIRAVYEATADPALPAELRNPTLVLGYVKHNGPVVLFENDQTDITVELDKKDKIIVFGSH